MFQGFKHVTDSVELFFGATSVTRETLPTIFPDLQFSYLNQVHGTGVVEANLMSTPMADAQFTSTRRVALVIQTADCLPIFLGNPQKVVAIHAGWRGILQNIIQATAAHFIDSPIAFAAIGPHITKESFEIDRALAEEFHAPDLELPHPDPHKVYFDLTELARRQLRQAFGPDFQLWEFIENTKTSHRFHSYRRDKAQAGRNLSFIVLR